MPKPMILSCESTVDVPFSYMQGRNIPVLFYNYRIDGMEYEDDMGRNPDALTWFYAQLIQGRLPSTSQINEFRYLDFFEKQLQKGDLLHIAFGSGMAASVDNALKAAEQLRAKYPERKIVVVDSLCSSSATVCWWTARPICATGARPWRRSSGGCWPTACVCTISSSPPT